ALTDFQPDAAANADKLYYHGSARAEAAFWSDYPFERRPPTTVAWRAVAPVKDYRFAPPAATATPPPVAASVGRVAVAATASGLILAAALDRRRSFERYASGWRQGSMNRFGGGGGGWGG